MPRRYFLAVSRRELEEFLSCQDKIADSAEDFAIILLIRKTKLHPSLKDDFIAFVDQVVKVSTTLLEGALELHNLAETSFEGAEANAVLEHIRGLGEEEWRADRMQRTLSKKIYSLEEEIDPLTIVFYDKMLHMLSRIANEAENTGDLLRNMIIGG